MNLEGCTATGPRSSNEDNYFTYDFSSVRSFANGVQALAVVSDGMGGYQGGDVASGIVVAQAERYLGQLLEMARDNQVALDAAAALDEIVQNAHAAILEEAQRNGGRSMGATFVGAFVSPSHAWIGHVGDSRAYLIRNGEAFQITEDHSQVGRMLRQGIITEEEAQNHPDRNKIEQALGFTMNGTEIDEIDLHPGDALLLCSDGVYTVLNSARLGGYVQNARDAAAAATGVVKAALSADTDDNSTAVVVYPDRTGRGARRKTTLSEADRIAPAGRHARVGARSHRQVTGRQGTQRQGAQRQGNRRANSTGHRPAASTASRRSSSASRQPARKTAQAAEPKSRKTLIISVVVAVILVAAAIGLAVFALRGGGGSAGGVVAPSGSSTTVIAQPATQSSQAISTIASSSSGISGEPYTLSVSDTALRYVDSEGTAQNFSHQGSIYSFKLRPGYLIRIQGDPEQYNMSNTYLTLSDDYLKNLRQDVSKYKDSQGNFSSSDYTSDIANILESDYGEFVEYLASDESPLDNLQKLIVLAEDPVSGEDDSERER